MKYDDLVGLFDTRVDDWTRYDHRMESLAKEIEAATGRSVVLDKDLSHNSGYSIRLLLDDTGNSGVPGDPGYRYSLRFYVSAKSDLFCVRNVYNGYANQWALENEIVVPAAIRSVQRSVERVLSRRGYKKLEDRLLRHEIPGRFDELGAPSTVFSALFSEII